MRYKWVALLIMVLFCAVWTAGCRSDSAYRAYLKASERTGQVVRGQSETAISMQLIFNQEGLPARAAGFLEIFGDLNLTLKREYDKDRKEDLNKIFLRLKDIGVDAKVYTKDGLTYVITPLIPKILRWESGTLPPADPAAGGPEKMPAPSPESLASIGKVWQSLLSDENVTALEKIVLNSPEGAVKATKYAVNLGDEQLKAAYRKTMEIIINDGPFMEGLEEMVHAALEEYTRAFAGPCAETGGFAAEGASCGEFLRSHMNALADSTIKDFSQVVFIDRDNYIIEERLHLDILYHFTGAETPRSFSLEMITKNWDFNKKQEIHFPAVTSENSITPGQLREAYPGGLNLFKREAD